MKDKKLKKNEKNLKKVGNLGKYHREYIIKAQNPHPIFLNEEKADMNDKCLVVNQFKKKVSDSLHNFRIDIYRKDAMDELTESIKMVGVLVPIIVRQIEDNKYEIISGHRRKRACEIAGVDKIPAVVAVLNDDEAAILLVDSNLHREKLLPSERAYAYKLKLEALKHQGIKNAQTCGQNVHNLKTRDEIGQTFGESGR